MFNKKVFIFAAVFLFWTIIRGFTAQVNEERTIDNILSDIRKEQGLKENDKINPDKVSPKLLDELGDAVMEQMIGNKDRHELMDQMMGGEGSYSLTAMHQRMGYNFLTGNIGGYGNGGMMGGGYNGMMGDNYNMMGNNSYNSPMNNFQFKGSPGYNFMMGRLSNYLNLDKEQNEKIQNININLEKEVSPLRIKILEKQNILYRLWSADKLDEKAIIKTNKEVFNILLEINEKAVNAQIKIAKVLTPEQKNKLPNMGIMGGFPMMYYRDNQTNP